jgi:hypothetical protein
VPPLKVAELVVVANEPPQLFTAAGELARVTPPGNASANAAAVRA